MAFDLFCALFGSAAEILLPLLVRQITDKAVDDPYTLTPRFLVLLGGGYALMRLVDALATYFMLAQGHYMGAKIETDMRNDLFGHLQGLSFSYYDNTKVGQLMSRLTTDLFEVTEFAHHVPEWVILFTVRVAACLIIFLGVAPVMALVVAALLPVMYLLTGRSRRRMTEAFREQRKQVGEINSIAEDSLLGIRVVKSFGNEAVENEKFRQANTGFFGMKKEAYRNMAQYHTITRLFDGLMYLAAVLFGAWLLRDRRLTVGDFSLILLLVSTLLGQMRMIIESSEQTNRGLTGIERFAEIMDEVTETQRCDGEMDLTDVRGEIEFENVSFVYRDTDRCVLKDFSLRIVPGESVALVGPSGGGKTTLCNLIPRFYDVTGGTVRVDGRDTRELRLSSLRRCIGVVQQDVYLFAGTVRENIAYGVPEADGAAIEEAARLAGAADFIEALPDGYNTYVGERGVKLSGGQKQRISIARVFLRNPPILLLDEATSALDNESERLVQASLERLAKGRTTLTIAHRLTTIRSASQIVVLTEGGVAESGTHEELLENEGLYAAMWNS